MTDAMDMLYSPTIEQAIIASLLIDPAAIHEIQLTPRRLLHRALGHGVWCYG